MEQCWGGWKVLFKVDKSILKKKQFKRYNTCVNDGNSLGDTTMGGGLAQTLRQAGEAPEKLQHILYLASVAVFDYHPMLLL